MGMPEEIGLEDPRPGAGAGGPEAIAPGEHLEEDTGREAEEQDGAKSRAWQILPGGCQRVSREAEQGVKRGMSVRLLASERPEVGQHSAIEEQLRAGVDLVR